MIVNPHRDVAHLTLLFEDDRSDCGVDRDEGNGADSERQAKSAIESRRTAVDMSLEVVDCETITFWSFRFHRGGSKPAEVCQMMLIQLIQSLNMRPFWC